MLPAASMRRSARTAAWRSGGNIQVVDEQLQGEGASRAERSLSVSELNRAARDLLELEFPDVWVRGELSRFISHRSGHWYFTLKDDSAAISAVMFKGSNRHVSVTPRDGLEDPSDLQRLIEGRLARRSVVPGQQPAVSLDSRRLVGPAGFMLD